MTAKGITLVYAQIMPVMAIVSLLPAIPRLLEEFGSNPSAHLIIPAIVTLPSLFCAVFAPIAGVIGDRFGRRPSLIFGMCLYVAAGIVPIFSDDLQFILVSRAALGIAEAFAITISSALVGDYFGEERHKWNSWAGIATSISGTALIAAGGFLADVSWRGPFFIYLAIIPALIMAIIYIDEPERPVDGPTTGTGRLPFPFREALLIGAVTLIASIVYYVEPLHIARVFDMRGAGSSTSIGLIQAATSIMYIVGALLYRRLHNRSVGQLLGLAALLVGTGQVIIGFGGTWQIVAIGAAVQQLGGGIIIPALLAWGQAILPLEQRARGMGIWATAFFTGTVLCSPFVSLVSQLSGGLLAAMTVLGFVTLLLAMLAPAVIPSSLKNKNRELNA